MSAHYDRSRDRWIVRWRENGRQRARRFVSEDEAVEFDRTINPCEPEPPARAASIEAAAEARDGSGVYPYETDDGVRWRFVYRQISAAHVVAAASEISAPAAANEPRCEFDAVSR